MVIFYLVFYYVFALLFVTGYNSDKLRERMTYVIVPLLCWVMFPICLGMNFKKLTEEKEEKKYY